jgi:hypothetical protein
MGKVGWSVKIEVTGLLKRSGDESYTPKLDRNLFTVSTFTQPDGKVDLGLAMDFAFGGRQFQRRNASIPQGARRFISR